MTPLTEFIGGITRYIFWFFIALIMGGILGLITYVCTK